MSQATQMTCFKCGQRYEADGFTLCPLHRGYTLRPQRAPTRPKVHPETRRAPAQQLDDVLRRRIRHISPEAVKALIDHINDLVDEDGKLLNTFLGETHRALRIALDCATPTDAEPLPRASRKPP